MGVLKRIADQEPILPALCLVVGVGLLFPAEGKPMLGPFQPSKQARHPALNDVVAGMTGKK